MLPFDPLKTLVQIRTDNRRRSEAAEVARSKRAEEEAAYFRRRAILYDLDRCFPNVDGDPAGKAGDARQMAALMVQYAQLRPAEQVRARVAWVTGRMAELASNGQSVEQAQLKSVLLYLLHIASEGDQARVMEVLSEALRGDADDVENFRLALANWLADKVVEGWPPLPVELKDDPPAAAPDRFIPTPRQRQILEILHGRAKKLAQLAEALHVEQTTLSGRDLKELKDAGLVQYHRRIGYYRPDAPPPHLALTVR